MLRTSQLRFALSLMILVCASLAGAADAPDRPYTRSWIYIDPSCNSRVLVSGETWEVPIEYSLDPAEAALARTLEVLIPGPWMDGPDGRYVKERHHEMYPGMQRSIPVQPGRHRETLRFTVPSAKPQGNSLLVIAAFSGEKGRWPWECRSGGIHLVRNDGFFELETAKPGNLFTYDEPVELFIRLKNVNGAADRKLIYKVSAADGSAVASGEIGFNASKSDQRVAIPLDIKSRGIFLAEVDVPGWEKRHLTFCRIPDVLKLTNNERTRFGLHEILAPKPRQRLEAEAQIARRLGLTACRQMVRWDSLEPGPGVFKLEPMDAPLDVAKQYGIDPIIMIDHPPAWVQTGPSLPGNIQYAPFEADWDAWADFVRTATTRFKGKMYAWEWLNEIVPGNDSNAVQNYVTLCRIGTKTAREVDPKIVTTLAGGLWPRSFRNALLTAGVAEHVDVLPIHYSDGSGVRQARADLQAIGKDLAIWDNETSRVLNAWDVPPLEQIADKSQSQWMLTRWTEELTAGAQKIFWFGGQADPAGNWSYLLGDQSPRPVAATLAVYAAKMHNAKPMGAFTLGNDSRLHLFARSGNALLVAWSNRPTKVDLATGIENVTITNYLGNESVVRSPDGVASIDLSPTPIFIEGAKLDWVARQVMLRPTQWDDASRPAPLTFISGRDRALSFEVGNPLDHPVTGTLLLRQGGKDGEVARFDLPAGARKQIDLPFASAQSAQATAVLSVAPFTSDVSMPLTISVAQPESMGNLLPNGDFERIANGRPAGWNLAEGVELVDAVDEGLGKKHIRFNDTKGGYRDISASVNLPGGQTYLYSAWVANQDMQAGSNVGLHFKDGTSRTLYNVQVFVTPPTNPYWQLYTAHIEAPANLVSATFSPVNKGNGWALFDNIRVTRFEGTDYMAEAYRPSATPKIDGKLDDWSETCPIPLLAPNQLTVIDKSYKWSPGNLRGVAYVSWDDSNLYVAVRVQDGKHVAAATGEDTPNDDSLILAFDPTNRGPDASQHSFAYYISSANPGGGSGKATVYRPAAHSGGLSSGHLLKDSSIYDLAISREKGVCTYELRIPFSELGTIRPALGTRVGFTIQLNDNDGSGRAAHMDWGQGISPAWQPMNFGLLTLLESPR